MEEQMDFKCFDKINFESIVRQIVLKRKGSKMDDEQVLDELAERVAGRIRELRVDCQISYERYYIQKYKHDPENLKRLMVDKELAGKEKNFLIQAMREIVTGDISEKIDAAYFRVLQRVNTSLKKKRRRNTWTALKQKSYAELKEEKKKSRDEARERLEREEIKEAKEKEEDKRRTRETIQALTTGKIFPAKKEIQPFFADIMDEVDRQRER